MKKQKKHVINYLAGDLEKIKNKNYLAGGCVEKKKNYLAGAAHLQSTFHGFLKGCKTRVEN